jgi:hypothetical protein
MPNTKVAIMCGEGWNFENCLNWRGKDGQVLEDRNNDEKSQKGLR